MRTFNHLALACLLLVVTAPLTGCRSASRPTSRSSGAYQTVAADPRRDTEAAQRHSGRALELIDKGKYDQAEPLLKKALDSDIMYGPAHNNLGKVYYHQGKLYLAAWEFQYAAQLLPQQPEPLNNLGLVYESAGKINDAVTAYEKAVALSPQDAVLLGNLARAKVRRGDRDAQTRQLLEKLILHETRPPWQQWARQTLSLMGPGTSSTQPSP